MGKMCQNCHSSFVIAEDDNAFYKKIDVPEPTACPSCRMQRRMSFRNERNLYKRQCDFSKKTILAIYPPTSNQIVYDQKIWWSDAWDALEFGQTFNFNQTFFEQFEKLLLKVPRINLQNRNNENSDYCNDTNDLKNCYLCFNAEYSEDCYYSNTFVGEKNCMDMFWCFQCELCYECTKTHNSYHSFFCFNCSNLTDCYFMEDCQSCENCFGCIGLRHKQHHIYNKQYTKEEYENFIKNFSFSHSEIQKAKEKCKTLRKTMPHKHLEIISSEDCEGDFISHSKNCTECFDVLNSENGKYIWDGIVNNSYDCFNTGLESNFLYECVGVYRGNNIKFADKCSQSSDLSYCDYCFQCEHLFGCVSLRHKKYCILNKQYTKKEYEALESKIIEHMKKTGEYGEFFPPRLSPFGYNDSMAIEYFPLIREEAMKKGFQWNDYVKPKITEGEKIKAKSLPNTSEEIPEDITSHIIQCEKDNNDFKIIPQEYQFYKKHKLSLPRLCPDCRHYERKAKINPRKLNNTTCDRCHKGIKTTLPDKTQNTVYCERCYLETTY